MKVEVLGISQPMKISYLVNFKALEKEDMLALPWS